MFPESVSEVPLTDLLLADEPVPDAGESIIPFVEKALPVEPPADTVPSHDWLSEKQLLILAEAAGRSGNAMQDALDQANTEDTFAHFLGLKSAEALSTFFTLSVPAQKLFAMLNFHCAAEVPLGLSDHAPPGLDDSNEITLANPSAANDAGTLLPDGTDDSNHGLPPSATLPPTNSVSPDDTATRMPDTAAMLQPDPPAGGGGAVDGQPTIVVPPTGNRVISLDEPASPRSGPDIESAGESVGSRGSGIQEADLSEASFVEQSAPSPSPVLSEVGDLPNIIEHPEESLSGQAAGDANISADDFENIQGNSRAAPHETAPPRAEHGSGNGSGFDIGIVHRLANIVGTIPANPAAALQPMTDIALNPRELAMVVGGLTVIAAAVITYEAVTIANNNDTTQADPAPSPPNDTTAPATLATQTQSSAPVLPTESVTDTPADSTSAPPPAPIATLMIELALKPASAAGTPLDAGADLIPGLRAGLGQWIAQQPSDHVFNLAGFDVMPNAGEGPKAQIYLDVGNASPTSGPLSTDNLFSLIASMRSFCEQHHSDAQFALQFDFLGLDMIAGTLLASPEHNDTLDLMASSADSSAGALVTSDAGAAELQLTGLPATDWHG